MAATAKLAGVHGLGVLGHQTQDREHGKDAGLLANSPVPFSRPVRAGKETATQEELGEIHSSTSVTARASQMLLDQKSWCGMGPGAYIVLGFALELGNHEESGIGCHPGVRLGDGARKEMEGSLPCGPGPSVTERKEKGEDAGRGAVGPNAVGGKRGGVARLRLLGRAKESGPRGEKRKPGRGRGELAGFVFFIFCFLFPKHFPNRVVCKINSHKKQQA